MKPELTQKITFEDFENCIKQGVEQAMKECELTIGMTLKEAVEKQIPKKPYEGHYEREGEKPYIKYSCPNNCGIQLHPVTERKLAYEHRYCPKCGQALDWGNEE